MDEDVLIARFDDGVVVFDLVSGDTHWLSPEQATALGEAPAGA